MSDADRFAGTVALVTGAARPRGIGRATALRLAAGGAHGRLRERGLLDDFGLTDAGRAAREGVEDATDACCRPAVDALGGDLDQLLGILEPWGAAVRQAGGYLPGGPHDLAAAAKR